MGFLNPWLYTVGVKGLNDIVRGNNPGCGTSGFDASEGWDPVTYVLPFFFLPLSILR